jgi:D-alanyl-lipoteichoic acid acyltransferase DltB (MBOAT superfamily)
VIADTCANLCDPIFLDYQHQTGLTLVMATFLFSVQIYGDFSGYSDMALGVSRLLGIELLRNFAFPYFSRDITEFWRRWHMSLSGWFRDYVYIPLGGSRRGNLKRVFNVMLVFLLSGFWHGANTGFLMWGFLNGLLFLPYVLAPGFIQKSEQRKQTAQLSDLPAMLFTFLIVNILWIFFRMATVTEALHYIAAMVSPHQWLHSEIKLQWLWILLPVFFLVEWLGRAEAHALAPLQSHSKPLRWMTYYSLIILVLEFWGKEKAFIYFQF